MELPKLGKPTWSDLVIMVVRANDATSLMTRKERKKKKHFICLYVLIYLPKYLML